MPEGPLLNLSIVWPVGPLLKSPAYPNGTTADPKSSSDSGSQVIALDEAGDEMDDSSATLMTDSDVETPAMAAMLEEEPGADIVDAAPLGDATPMMTTAAVGGVPVAREAPYTIWNILGLTLCLFVLGLTGMMMFDLCRSMWSWNEPYPINSSIMDWMIRMFEG